MSDRMTYLRSLRRRASVTVKAHYRLSDGSTRVMIFGNSYKTWREQMDEYEDWGQRADLTLIELYSCPERFVQKGLRWSDYGQYQAALDGEAAELGRAPRQLERFEWTPLATGGAGSQTQAQCGPLSTAETVAEA